MTQMLTCPFTFGGYSGTAYRHEHRWWVPARPVADFLGLGWSPQRRKIQSDDALSVVIIMITAADGKNYETLALQTADLGFWLRSISPSKVAQSARPMLIEMQRRMRDAVEAQVNEAFGLPMLADYETLLDAPVPAHVDAGMMREVRAERLAEPDALRAAVLFRAGLPGTKVAVLTGRSAYWARKERRVFEALSMVEARRKPSAANDDAQQADLFGSTTHEG
ncbi:phage antirepressor N-terminal domain-containing protein [Polymorphobacter sp.]|uniref:phage antirepressor N-terminal domain-containing protein n=1 Tax=Polymorphobacter sp. TaxID=1909290 RepID=UPI003F721989